MQTELIHFSSILQTNPTYNPAADRLFAALTSRGVPCRFLENTRDIWVRDFMPVRTRTGKYSVSNRIGTDTENVSY